jgi:phage shock protein PspC (stress-responsive transcriptional regulator)
VINRLLKVLFVLISSFGALVLGMVLYNIVFGGLVLYKLVNLSLISFGLFISFILIQYIIKGFINPLKLFKCD